MGESETWSIRSGLDTMVEQENFPFHPIYEAKVRDKDLEGKVKREKRHRAARFLRVLNASSQPFLVEGWGL